MKATAEQATTITTIIDKEKFLRPQRGVPVLGCGRTGADPRGATSKIVQRTIEIFAKIMSGDVSNDAGLRTRKLSCFALNV